MMFDRRDVLKGGAAMATVAVSGIGPTLAQDKVVKIGMIACRDRGRDRAS